METPLPCYFNLLRKCVLAKAGITTLSPGDCKRIAAGIVKATGKPVSETTLKRFFGFADRRFSFSLFTLNTLCEYAGYGEWRAFVEEAAQTAPERMVIRSTYWEALRSKAAGISDITLKAVQNRSGIPFGWTVSRRQVEADFEYFIQSPFRLTTFTAPPGAGKSVLLTHLVWKFFRDPASRYYNSIAWFVHAGILNNLAACGFRLDDWFKGLAGPAGNADFRSYFKQHPGEVNGKIFLILDGFDEYVLNDEQLNRLFDNIAGQLCCQEETDWIKIVAAMRPPAWMVLEEKLSGSGYLKSSWYPGRFFREENHFNVPLLNREEIGAVLSRIEHKPVEGGGLPPRLIARLRYPFYMELYYQLKEKETDFAYDRQYTYFELVSEFVLKKVYRTKRSTEKIALIHRFVTLAGEDFNNDFIEKRQLLAEIDRFPEAYEELLNAGVWVEENRSDNLSHREVIRFIHNDIFEYFLAQELIGKYKSPLKPGLFREIAGRFEDMPLRMSLLKWVIRSALKDNDPEGIKTFLRAHLSPPEKNQLLPFVNDVLQRKPSPALHFTE